MKYWACLVIISVAFIFFSGCTNVPHTLEPMYKEYENKELGFRIQYPEYAEVRSGDIGKLTGLGYPYERVKFFLDDTTSINVMVVETNIPLTEYDERTTERSQELFNTQILESTQSQISGHPAIKKIILYPKDKTFAIISSKNEKIYIVSFAVNLQKYDEILQIAQKMIDTFEFIQPTKTITTTPTILVPINLKYTYSPSSGTAPLSVTFTDQSTGPITSWQWDFGDGTNSNERSPKHVYTQKGTYKVKLTVCGNDGCESKNGKPDIIVNEPEQGGECKKDSECNKGTFGYACCNGKCYNTLTENCCGGKVYSEQESWYTTKLGVKFRKGCCAGKLITSEECCNGVIYDSDEASCCNGKIYSGENRCCGSEVCPEGQECCGPKTENPRCYDPDEYICYLTIK